MPNVSIRQGCRRRTAMRRGRRPHACAAIKGAARPPPAAPAPPRRAQRRRAACAHIQTKQARTTVSAARALQHATLPNPPSARARHRGTVAAGHPPKRSRGDSGKRSTGGGREPLAATCQTLYPPGVGAETWSPLGTLSNALRGKWCPHTPQIHTHYGPAWTRGDSGKRSLGGG